MWAMIYADDADIVSRTPDGLIRMVVGVMTPSQEFGFMFSESKTESVYLWSVSSFTETALHTSAVRQ